MPYHFAHDLYRSLFCLSAASAEAAVTESAESSTSIGNDIVSAILLFTVFYLLGRLAGFTLRKYRTGKDAARKVFLFLTILLCISCPLMIVNLATSPYYSVAGIIAGSVGMAAGMGLGIWIYLRNHALPKKAEPKKSLPVSDTVYQMLNNFYFVANLLFTEDEKRFGPGTPYMTVHAVRKTIDGGTLTCTFDNDRAGAEIVLGQNNYQLGNGWSMKDSSTLQYESLSIGGFQALQHDMGGTPDRIRECLTLQVHNSFPGLGNVSVSVSDENQQFSFFIIGKL